MFQSILYEKTLIYCIDMVQEKCPMPVRQQGYASTYSNMHNIWFVFWNLI